MQEIINRFRVDTFKLSDEDFPIVDKDGSTCYEVDTMNFYIYYKGEWYLQSETQDEDNQEQEG